MTLTNKHRYRFAGIEVDAAQSCVRRNGEERHLRQQTLQVLVYLLEQRDRLVTKDELLGNIWSGTSVTDDALVQCVMDIRRALGDDSRHPRFIKTTPKVGYRFIGELEDETVSTPPAADKVDITTESGAAEKPVSSKESAPDSAPPHLPQPAPDASLPAQTRGRIELPRRPLTLLTISLLVIVSAGASAIYLRRERRASTELTNFTLTPADGKKPIAIMYFENQSGDSDLNWLREGLADMMITELSRSRNLAVLSRQQLQLLLDRAGHIENAKIQLDEALDVAHKSQASIVMLGSFARLGDQMRIDVHLHDARNGQLLTAERLIVEKPDQILSQVDVLALKLASYLGVPASEDQQIGLSTVMTDSLEAYRYYSLGVEKAQALQNPEAISLLEKAVALDSQFAMAYARIGYVYAVSWGRVDDGRPYLEKAFRLSERLTEKDKLYITAWYAIANLDYANAIKCFRDIVARFPLEVEAYYRLASLLQGEERPEESVAVLKQALVIDSEAKELYNALGGNYVDLDRQDEAITAYERYVQLAPREPNAHDSLANGYQWAGRYDEAIAEYNRALALKPDFDIALIHLGNAYFQQGRYRDAITQYEQYIQRAPSNFERVRGYNSIAYIQLRKGNLEQARQTAKTAARLVNQAVAQLLLIALEENDLATARKLKETLERSSLIDRGRRGTQRPLLYCQASFDLKVGRTAEALAEFRDALTHRPPTWDIDAFEDCLANAYLELGQVDEAISEYERILKLNPNYPLVHYHLGQAYQRKGQLDRAHGEYQQFLQTWPNADRDVPEIVSAEKELSR